MLRAQGTAINIKRKNAGFRWLSAYGNLHFAFSFTAPLLYRNIATAIAQIAPLIRNLPKGEETEYRGKYYLRVIID